MSARVTGYVDADGHVRDEDEKVRRYLKGPMSGRFVLGRGARQGFDRTMGLTLGVREVDAQLWLEMLDEGGLATTVLYPTAGLAIGFLREADFAVAKCRAYNDFTYEEYLELRRAVTELGMLGDGLHLVGKPAFDPIHEEAQRLGFMLAVHGPGDLWGGIDEFLFDRFIQAHTLVHPFAQMRHFVSVLFEGVPEKFPELRIAFLEAGCGWTPFLLDRMDERYRFRGKAEAPILRKSPWEYFHDGNLYVSCEADESLLPEAVRLLGEDVILYATDFPHWDGSYPESLRELLERGDLREEQKLKIAGENATVLYRLD